MRTILILIFSFLIPDLIFGQSDNLSLAELDSMYVKTLDSQIELALSSGHKYFEINENTDRIKDMYEVGVFKFKTNDELVDEAIKRKKILTVYRVAHKVISADTVDVNIGQLCVSAKRAIHFNHGLKFKKANFGLLCSGTNGYVPTCRFVFDKTDEKWKKLEK